MPLSWALVGLFTIAALALRVRGIGQALALDETLTFSEIHGHSLGDVIPQMRAHGEDNPPLYYLLAWFGAQTGHDTVTIRLPSLILGTLSVPLVFLLGARTVGRAPGVLAAAFAALSPFGLFYAAEARAYATATFLSAASTLVLLRALESRSRWWWAAYAASATALLYTHYTAVFVLAAQGAWALVAYRRRWRALVVANAVAAFAFLPWAATAKGGDFETVVGGPLHPSLSTFEALLAVFPGQPYSQILRPSLEQFPGLLALTLLGAGVLVGVVGVATARGRPITQTMRSAPPVPLLLLGGLALASPAGVFLYAVTAHNIFLSRYFSASLPSALVLVAWLLLRPRGTLRVAAVALATAGLLIGTARSFEERFRRPPLDDMAAYIRERTRPGDVIVENSLPLLAFLSEPLHAYLEEDRSFSFDPQAGSEVWHSEHVAIVTSDLSILPIAPARWGPGLCFRRFADRAFAGVVDEGVAIYSLGPRGGACLRAIPRFATGFGPHEEDLTHQWSSMLDKRAEVVLTNRRSSLSRVKLSMSLDRVGGPPAPVVVSYPDGASVRVTAGERPVVLTRTLRLRPGRSVITLTASRRPVAAPSGPPRYLRLLDLRVDPER